MLRTVLNVSWRDHITNEDLYGHFPKVSGKIRERRMRVAEHCVRHKGEGGGLGLGFGGGGGEGIEGYVVAATTRKHGKTKRRRPRTT